MARRTAALGPEDGDDGVREAPPGEPRGGGEPLHRGRVHLAARAHHLRRVALPAARLHRPARPLAAGPKQGSATARERKSTGERDRCRRRRWGFSTWFYGRNNK